MAQVRCVNEKSGLNWSAIQGDCVDVSRQMPDASVDFSIYSPPFAAIFVYSPSECDMGNCASDEEFREHYQFLVDEMFRVTKPGRLTAVHCSDLPMTKWKDGEIGLKDFMGDIVAAHRKAGFVLHSRVTIWRDPVVEMTRTKALGLLYKQVTKDSTRSRVGMPDYLCVFRKPGENGEPVFHPKEQFPVDRWQKLASPVWMNIRQTRTLNSSTESGIALSKDAESERHLCPLQLDVIENALFLWSNPGDVVFSPFMGIGSEGAMALKHKRKFIGTELKDSYWRQACKHLESSANGAADLFAEAAE
jgi:DNA modification methylase